MSNRDRVDTPGVSPATAPARSPMPVPYDTRGDHVTRRQFRLLLVLTAINTILLGAVVAGPILVPYLREQWSQHQQRREERLAEQQRLEQVRKHLATVLAVPVPPETVMYTEDPDEASSLLSSDGPYRTVPVRRPRNDSRSWRSSQPAVYHDPPEAWTRLTALQKPATSAARTSESDGIALLFFGEMVDRNGNRRLIEVTMKAEEIDMGMMWSSQSGAVETIRARRTLYARTLDPDLLIQGTPQNAQDQATFMLQIHEGQTLSDLMPMPPRLPDLQNSATGIVSMRQPPIFRFYAGQPDPADAQRFTIAYEADGHGGVIDGQLLTNGRVILEPREGQVLSRGRSAVLWTR